MARSPWRSALVRLKFRCKFLFADYSKRKLQLPFATGICLAGYLTAEAQLEAALRSGCTHWYIDVSLPGNALPTWSPERVKMLLRRMAQTGLRPVVHGDFTSPLASSVETVRMDAVARTVREMDLASELGGVPLVVHPMNDPSGRQEPRDRSAELDCLLRSLAELEPEARRRSVPLWLENLPTPEAAFSDPEAFERILAAVPTIAMVYDVGHANVRAGKPERALVPFAPRIAAICLSDNHGDTDSHLPVGRGSINWGSLLARLRQSQWRGVIVFEAPQAPPKASVDYLNATAR